MTDEKSFIRRIPGFRTGTWWKMGLAVLGYGFIILLIIGLLFPGESPTTTTVKTPAPTQAETGIQVEIDYSGKWQGALGTGANVKSVSGNGAQTFTLQSNVALVSVNAQKMDDSSKTLTVSILKNGKVVATENTNAAYGVAMTSASV